MSNEILIFMLFTTIFMGGAGYLTGQAIASTWRPAWQLIAYSLILGGFDRFLVYALFSGQLLSLSGYVIDSSIILFVALIGFKQTRARIMVTQYPWLYERKGLMRWREIDNA